LLAFVQPERLRNSGAFGRSIPYCQAEPFAVEGLVSILTR
jgi:hypothetical protein